TKPVGSAGLRPWPPDLITGYDGVEDRGTHPVDSVCREPKFALRLELPRGLHQSDVCVLPDIIEVAAFAVFAREFLRQRRMGEHESVHGPLVAGGAAIRQRALFLACQEFRLLQFPAPRLAGAALTGRSVRYAERYASAL